MITTKGRYALRVLLDIMEHEADGYIPLKDVASRQEISKKYLEIIMKDLVRGGFVSATSGKGGGYRLTKSPDQYSVGEILEYMEGTLASVACLAKDAADCPRASQCQTLPLWVEYDQMVHDFFYSKRLADLARIPDACDML